MTEPQSDPGCACLLCAAPGDEAAWDERDRLIAANVREYGWHVMGVTGDGPGGGTDWAYSTGLWHSLRSPEVCVFGLPSPTAMRVVNAVAARVKEGHGLAPDQRRDDVLEGYEVVVRPVHPSWYPAFFGAGLDFQQGPPWPVAQVLWPDKAGRLPWEEDAAEECRAGQPPLWLPRDRAGGPWAAHDPLAGWPFGATLPYATVLAAPEVADGTAAVARVERDAEGGWRFLAAGAAGEPAPYPLGLIVNAHPDLAAVGALPPGAAVERAADGGWPPAAPA